MNDRYWGITLPAKMDQLLNDQIDITLIHDVGQVGDPPSSPGTFEYHSEETCLQCYNYLDTSQTNSIGNFVFFEIVQRYKFLVKSLF